MKIIITEEELAKQFINEFQLGMFINTLIAIGSFSKNIEIEFVFVSSSGKERVTKLKNMNEIANQELNRSINSPESDLLLKYIHKQDIKQKGKGVNDNE